MKALAEALELYWPDKRICGLVGMLDDKQREQALAHIMPRLERVIVTRPGYPARSKDWAGVGDVARAYGKEPLLMEDSAAALDAALNTDCDMVLICGSLYLAADLRGLFPTNDRLFDVK